MIAFLALGALGVADATSSARHWFGPAAGVVAALVILTRIPVLSFGVRAYVDIPYVALVLGAILAEARGRAPARPLILLALAGLLRPEAWLLSLAYVAWRRDPRLLPLALSRARPLDAPRPRARRRPAALACTGTRDNAEVLERTTGLHDVPLHRPAPARRDPARAAACSAPPPAACSCWRSCAGRRALPIAAGFASIAAFCVLAAAGLPILGRYLLLPAALLAVFCGRGRVRLDCSSPRDHPWRTRWAAIGAAVAGRVRGLRARPGRPHPRPARARWARRRTSSPTCTRSRDDVRRAARSRSRTTARSRTSRCGPASRRREIVSAQLEQPTHGVYVDPATERVRRNFTLDPHDPKTLTAAVPPGFTSGATVVALYERASHARRVLTPRSRDERKMDRAPSVEVGLQGLLASLTPVGRPRNAHR